jgi:hypothetical protein
MHDARVLAFAAGEKFYWTGEPCKHGHLAKRRTDSTKCTKCQLEYKERAYWLARAGEIPVTRKRGQQGNPSPRKLPLKVGPMI